MTANNDTQGTDKKKDILVLGLGNLLMEDEGIGLYILRHLKKNFKFTPEIDMVDGGTAGFELLPFFEDYRRILMLDAVEFGEEPGFAGRYDNDDILMQLQEKMSLHHLGITDVLSSAKLMEYGYEHLVMLGVQPQSMEVRLGLSDLLQSRVEYVAKAAVRVLEDWGVTAEPIEGSEDLEAVDRLMY